MKHKVYCKDCANLLLLKDLPPLCVATAFVVPGPIRKVVDVQGVELALERNKTNYCTQFRRYSLAARKMKRLVRETLDMAMVESLDEVLTQEKERDFVLGKEQPQALPANKEPKASLESTPDKQVEEDEGDDFEDDWDSEEHLQAIVESEGEENGNAESKEAAETSQEPRGVNGLESELRTEENQESIWRQYRENPELLRELTAPAEPEKPKKPDPREDRPRPLRLGP